MKRVDTARPTTTLTAARRSTSARSGTTAASPGRCTSSASRTPSVHQSSDGDSWPTSWPCAMRCGVSAATRPASRPAPRAPQAGAPMGTSNAHDSELTTTATPRAGPKPSQSSAPRPARYLLTGGCSEFQRHHQHRSSRSSSRFCTRFRPAVRCTVLVPGLAGGPSPKRRAATATTRTAAIAAQVDDATAESRRRAPRMRAPAERQERGRPGERSVAPGRADPCAEARARRQESGDSELAGTYSGAPRRPGGFHSKRAPGGAAKRTASGQASGQITRRLTSPWPRSSCSPTCRRAGPGDRKPMMVGPPRGR